MTIAGKDRDEISKNSSKTDAKQSLEFSQTVSEGSTVVLDAQDFIKDIDTNKSYSWKQTKGISVADLRNETTHRFSFTAPYILDNKVNTTLSFELTATDNSGKTSTHNANVIVKRVHRAIIFQGGVSLGAYEAGVFQALVEKISEDQGKRGLENGKRPLFDIVAGTSIGAMNAAIVVSSIIEGKNWKDSSKKLVEFWKNQEYQWPTVADSLDINPIYHYWWNIMHIMSKVAKRSASTMIEAFTNLNPYFNKYYNDMLMDYFFLNPNFWKDYFINGWYIPSTAEAARRYYSAKQFHTLGAPNVASGIIPWSIFGKFFDITDQSNFNPRADNKHLPGYSLKNTLEHFVHSPIKTKEGQLRFLLVTVDVQTGDAVTFDSYEKGKPAMDANDKILKYENGYNNETKYYSEYGVNEQSKHVIFYDKGIGIEHILASGTFPNFFDYPKFKVENPETNSKNKEHIFWDGGFRSNTPLREVIHAHREYWHKKDNEENDVPDLEVYIADLWPSELKEEPISFDHDFVENRKLNIIFSDKTHYDEQVAEVVSDYIDLAKKLKNLAERSGASKKEINSILEKHGRSKSRKGNIRMYNNLLGGRFRLTKVVRIDHKDDGNEVANKIYDYSYTTIEKLMKDGYYDAINQMGIQSIKDGIIKIDNKNGSSDDVDSLIQRLEDRLQQIQNSTKMDDGYDSTMKEVKNLISEVESIPDTVDNLSINEEKALLIHAAKQFEEIIENKKS
jgi:predicted acylesterase/phospholipase RssA